MLIEYIFICQNPLFELIADELSRLFTFGEKNSILNFRSSDELVSLPGNCPKRNGENGMNIIYQNNKSSVILFESYTYKLSKVLT